MSKPSFSNIDLWLFEYAEGNLTPDQVAQLELFVLQHPELDVERDMWEMAKVNKVDTVYPETENLYRRRKPIALYMGAGFVALLLLLFFGYQGVQSFNDSNKTNSGDHGYAAKTSANQFSAQQELRGEISDLKILIASLEDELRTTRGTHVYTTNLSDAGQNNAELQNQAGAHNSGSTASLGLNQSDPTVGVPNNGNALAVNGANTGAGLNTINGVLPVQQSASQNNVGGPLNHQTGNSVNEPSSILNILTPAELANNWSLELAQTLEPTSSRDLILSEEHVTADNEDAMAVPTFSANTMSSNYDYSYKYRMAKFMRSVKRMIDNPIALKNSRDPYYHVPGMSTTDVNIGATGTVIAPRLQVLSSARWLGETNELFTNQIALDGYAYSLRGGVGMQMTHQYYNQGGIQNTSVALTYSPKISINRKLSLEPALRFKMGNKSLDASRMEGQSAVELLQGNVVDYYADGTNPVGDFLWYKDLGLGMNINTEWFYVSAQVDNIFRHHDNIYSGELMDKRRAGTHFVATIGTDWESKKSSWETKKGDFGLSPYLVYQKYEDVNELWAGANFRAHWFSLGAAISSNLDPAASLGFIGPKKHLSLLYNVDYMQSVMTGKRSLSHQLTLRIVGKPNRTGRRLLNQ